MISFNQRKQDIFSKKDKSFIGCRDEKIKKLCGKINKKESYYTTSSCSGRVVVIKDKEKKEPGVFEFVSHDLLDLSELKKELSRIISQPLQPFPQPPALKNKLTKKPVNNKRGDNNFHTFSYKFKQEPCILHVACRELGDAEKLLKKAQLAGFKRSGIISSKGKFVCELLSTEKLEFPIIEEGRLLVGDDFLKVVVKKANKNLEKTWLKIENLEKSL